MKKLLKVLFTVIIAFTFVVNRNMMAKDNEKVAKEERSIINYQRIQEEILDRDSFDKKWDSRYGGAYIDDEGELVILFTEDEFDNSVEEIKKIKIESGVKFTKANYSLEYLNYIRDSIRESIEVLKEKDIFVARIAVMEKENVVQVGILNLDKEMTKAFDNIIGRKGIEIINLDEIPSKESAPVQLGGEIYNRNDGRRGTLGYYATKDGKTYLVTAGHVAPGIGNVIQDTYTTSGSYEDIGSVVKTNSLGYYDAAFIELYSGYDKTNMTTYGTTITSVNTGVLPVGSSVTMYGQNSGVRTGTISSTSEDVLFGTDWNYDLVKANYSSVGGDSGGTIVKNGQLQGIHIGGESYYCKYKNINTWWSHSPVLY